MAGRSWNGGVLGIRGRVRALAALLVCACAASAAVLLSTEVPASRAAGHPVYVFPIPGGRVGAPQTQLTFRGIPATAIGTITVTGSASGVHQGSLRGDSDGHGGSFMPSTPFTPGETVSVQTSLNIVGGHQGDYQFRVATPAPHGGGGRFQALPSPSLGAKYVQRFHSRPDLEPARVRITKHGRTAPGEIFLAPQGGPVQNGPMIIDNNGSVVWFKALPGNLFASDFRVDTYHGQRVLTWWQGTSWFGVGFGENVINNSAYQQIATVQAGNGLAADHHEFHLTPQGTALLVSEYPVYWNTSSIHGPKQEAVLDSVVQEIDIPTGLVLFQWDSLDHVPLSYSYQALPRAGARAPYDPYHVNSVSVDLDGNLIISARNTNGIYKVNRRSAAMMWILGGKRSSFKLAGGTFWALQHDATIQSYGDNWLTMFDDDLAIPGRASRGLKIFLDPRHMTAHAVSSYSHSPLLYSGFEGNYEQLPNRDEFVGWGQQPYFSEYNAKGALIFDGKMTYPFDPSYRIYRFRWTGAPQTRPAVAASPRGKSTVVWVSWNGSTSVGYWRVLGGSSPGNLATVTQAKKNGFETAISVPAQGFVAVQALSSSGAVLGTSATVAPH
jgi:Arylsulfotransferase (ASST)